MTSMAPIPPIARLSDTVVRVLAPNPGVFTLQGSNTYLVGRRRRCLLIDTGQGLPGYLPRLQNALSELGFDSIAAILLTHRHHDHVGGVDNIRKRFGSDIPVYKRRCSCGEHLTDREDFLSLEDGDEFTVDGLTLSTLFTPGHTCDHVCFVLGDTVFTGDCVLGSGSSTVFTSLQLYMESLRRLLALRPQRLYPGHGEVVHDGVGVLETTLQHRLDREQQVLSAFGSQTAALSAMELVGIVYEGKLVPELVHAATNTIYQHVEKLMHEGRVRVEQLDDSEAAETKYRLVN